MTDTTPALNLGDHVLVEAVARCDEDGVTLVLSPLVNGATRAGTDRDLEPRHVRWLPMSDAAELATLRRELAEARDETAAAKKALDDERHAELSDAVRNLDAVSNGYRWLKALRDGLAQRGIPTTQWRDVTPTALARLDEAVAETARVRTVYREAKDRLRNALEVTAAIWDAEAERLIEVRDKSGDRAKRLRVEAAAHAYRACHHALLAVLTSPLDGAATTGPETAPAPRQGDEQLMPPMCAYADRDLFTNKRLRCDKRDGHDGIHRMVFDFEPKPAESAAYGAPPATQEPTAKDGT